MTKMNKHIEIVSSAVCDLSSMSQESRQAIYDVLTKHYTKVGITIVNTHIDLEALIASRPDLVFLGMKYIPKNPLLGQNDPNKIWLSKYLENSKIAHTGSDHLAHELELDKSLAKQRVLDAGLKTSPFYVIKQNQPSTRHANFSFPLFVKPTDRGGGEGIDSDSVVHDAASLQSKVRSITCDLQADSLVEQYLSGREFSVAILKDESSNDFSIMPLELIAPLNERGARVLSAKIKSADTESSLEVTDKIIKDKISTLAIDVFHALGARDYGRIDIRLDATGAPHFLEANLVPSLKKSIGNYFPKACSLNTRLDYEPMILTIVRLALSRQQSILQDESEFEMSHTMTPALLKSAA
jgi:D-alanine-D-alanine ligase